jgi:hypothetical protein
MPLEERVNLLTFGLVGLTLFVFVNQLRKQGTLGHSSGYSPRFANIPPPSPLPLPPPPPLEGWEDLGVPVHAETPCGCGS